MRLLVPLTFLVALASPALAHGGALVEYVGGNGEACAPTPVTVYTLQYHVGGACNIHADGHLRITARADEGAGRTFLWRATASLTTPCGEGSFVDAIELDLAAPCTHISIIAPAQSLGGRIVIVASH